MKSYVMAATFLVLSSTGLAQQAADEAAGSEAQNSTATTKQIVIVNQPSVQQQPATNVEAQPLVESHADELRRARQGMEVNTERQLVEKLEASRLEDEKTRVNRVFGQKQDAAAAVPAGQATQTVPAQQAQVAPVVAPPITQAVAPVTQTVPPAATSQTIQVQIVPMAPAPAPAPVTVEPEHKKPTVDGADDVQGDLVDGKDKDKDKEEKPEEKRSTYFAGMLGMSQYPRAVNVQGNYAGGFSVGKLYSEHSAIEGFFTYANYSVTQVDQYGQSLNPYYPWIKNLDQYNIGAAYKYRFMTDRSSVFSPYIGAAGAIVLRNYQDTSAWSTGTKESSQAFDIGPVLGADFRMSERFSLGLDFRYFTNVTYRSTTPNTGSSFVYQGNAAATPLEKIDYYFLTISGTFLF